MASARRDEVGLRRLTIGKVLAQLEPDFPDVTASKIRFLEAEGLVTPERTPSGYRTYSAEDVGRLRYILGAQRDRYWPLRVIREALDALDRGLADSGGTDDRPLAPPPVDDPELPTPEQLLPATPVLLTGPELRQASGIDKPTLAALENFGLVQANDRGHFPGEAIAVAVAARRLAEHGLEPRHLRAFRTAADREIGLAEQVLATRRGGPREERTAEIISECIALHVALVRAGLNRRR